ncbi:MAG: hypothetical protein HY686_03545 [Chloroflexi bacterium]|nr:hypothetical protein [Chloroflexota bacterium]
MEHSQQQRVQWKENPNAVERGFDFYLTLLERRLKGAPVSLVQGLRRFYNDELAIALRETQARGLMHKDSSVFIDYVESVLGSRFVPGIQHWEQVGLGAFLEWREQFYRARNLQAPDVQDALEEWLGRMAQSRGGVPERQEVVINR